MWQRGGGIFLNQRWPVVIGYQYDYKIVFVEAVPSVYSMSVKVCTTVYTTYAANRSLVVVVELG
jgi:hypothetical protein